jgi:hypothetical protein
MSLINFGTLSLTVLTINRYMLLFLILPNSRAYKVFSVVIVVLGLASLFNTAACVMLVLGSCHAATILLPWDTTQLLYLIFAITILVGGFSAILDMILNVRLECHLVILTLIGPNDHTHLEEY